MASSIRCTACDRDRSDDPLVDDGGGLVPCPGSDEEACGATGVSYAAETPAGNPEPERLIVGHAFRPGPVVGRCGWTDPAGPRTATSACGLPLARHAYAAGALQQVRTERCPRCEVGHAVYEVVPG